MRLLLIISFILMSLGSYASALVPNDCFSRPLSIHSSIADTVAPNMSLPEGTKIIGLGEEEKIYRSWIKISLLSSWATLGFLLLSIFFSPYWGFLCIITTVFSLVWAIDALRGTKHKPLFRKVRKRAKWALFIPILYIFTAILAGIGLVFIYLGD